MEAMLAITICVGAILLLLKASDKWQQAHDEFMATLYPEPLKHGPLLYGRRRVDRMRAEVNALRAAIRSHDTYATEAAWDKLEEWLDLSMLSRLATAEGMK